MSRMILAEINRLGHQFLTPSLQQSRSINAELFTPWAFPAAQPTGCAPLHPRLLPGNCKRFLPLYGLCATFNPFMDFAQHSWSFAADVGRRWISIWIFTLVVWRLRAWISAGLRRSIRRTVAWIWIWHFLILPSSPSCLSGALSRLADPFSSGLRSIPSFHSWIESILPQPLP